MNPCCGQPGPYKCSSNHKHQQSLSDISNDINRKICLIVYPTKKIILVVYLFDKVLMLTNQNCEVNISNKFKSQDISPSDRIISIQIKDN